MAQVTFVSGNVDVCDYTAGATISAGDVIVTADTPRIAQVDIANGAVGALVVRGGIWRCTGDAAIATNKKVYWDNTNDKVTETSSGNKLFGVTTSACSADGSTCLVYFAPI